MASHYLKLARRGEIVLRRLSSHKCTEREFQRGINYLTKIGISSKRTSPVLTRIFGSNFNLPSIYKANGNLQRDTSGGPNKGGGGGKGNDPNIIPRALALGVIAAAFMLYRAFKWLLGDTAFKTEITWAEFVSNYLGHEKIEKLLVVDKQIVKVYTESGTNNVFFSIGSVESFEKNLMTTLQERGLDKSSYVNVAYHTSKEIDYVARFLTAANIAFLMVYLAQRSNSLSFGQGGFGKMFDGLKSYRKTTARKVKSNVKFSDVAGCEEAKIEIMEFVNFMKNPNQYAKLGAKLPKGALLTGPPGTGKTLLAKATAGEAGVDFITVSASEFMEVLIGVGPTRVKDMFKMARNSAPCILFIDEIDSVGKKRHQGGGTGHVERDSTLNQILVELDGFNSQTGVVVLAATNRIDILDNALLRPGRFDRQIYVGLPDIKGRASIFKVYLKDLKTEAGIDKDDLARKLAAMTHSMSGADIASVCNEAALIAARSGSKEIQMHYFEMAVERVIGGLEKKTRVLSPEEKKVIAYHEAGHAIVGWFLEHANPLLKVSIVPRGEALGYAQIQPKEQYLYNKEQLLHQLCVFLGGRVSEEIHFGQVTSGALDDLRKVTKLAYDQVAMYGMSDKIGHLSFDFDVEETNQLYKPFSQKTSEAIDLQARKIIEEAKVKTRELLLNHKEDIRKVAEALIENEKIDKTDMINLIGKRPFVEKTTYDDFVKGTGSFEEDTTLPKGLRDWNKENEENVKKE